MGRKYFGLFGPFLCALCLSAAIAPRHLHAENRKSARDAIDQSVLEALGPQRVTKPKVVLHLDLTEPFDIGVQWTLVAVQEENHPVDDFENHGPLYLCLVKELSPECDQHMYPQVETEMASSATPYQLLVSSVVYAGSSRRKPLLFLKVCGASGANGNCSIATALYRYDREAAHFVRVFLNSTGRNNNQSTRFVESGSLQGDLIVDFPTDTAPYVYWIEVYRADQSGQYSQSLRYRSLTHYSDGNLLSVADSEMPEILRRLGFWKSGDPLPVPAHMPRGCKILYMKQGEEWCK